MHCMPQMCVVDYYLWQAAKTSDSRLWRSVVPTHTKSDCTAFWREKRVEKKDCRHDHQAGHSLNWMLTVHIVSGTGRVVVSVSNVSVSSRSRDGLEAFFERLGHVLIPSLQSLGLGLETLTSRSRLLTSRLHRTL